MKISKIARREAKELFRAAQIDGLLDDSRVRRVVDEVLAGKPRGYAGILSNFQRLVKLELARRSARIETVTPLNSRQQTDVKAALTKRYGKGLIFAFAQNLSLIGGMRVQVGSDVFDGSIQSRLDELKESF